jgi:hypothetical protein
MNNTLDDVYDLIITDEIKRATFIIDSITGHTSVTYDIYNVNSPHRFSLMQNYPNPFNASTRIDYIIFQSDFVNISVFNVNGQLIDVLVNEHKNTGNYTVIWETSVVSSGIYFYRIKTGNGIAVKKCLKLN